MPGSYEDLELADLVVLVGSNLAWCHPVLYQRLAAAKAARHADRASIDPRRTATCEIADLHLPLRPGRDVALFNGLLAYLASVGADRRRLCRRHTTGLDAGAGRGRAMASAESPTSPASPAPTSQRSIELFAETRKVGHRLFARASTSRPPAPTRSTPSSTVISPPAASASPGMGPFSITGQPNAMGGREVGGLANSWPRTWRSTTRPTATASRRFWQRPRIAERPGLKAVDLFDAVADGRIKAIWIMATNPVVSLPDAEPWSRRRWPLPLRRRLRRDRAHTDTDAPCRMSCCPQPAWGEKDGTVTNSERRISRQRAFLPPPGEARPDWWIVAEVARRMGYGAAFDYADAAADLPRACALSAFENDGTRDFDLAGLAGIDERRLRRAWRPSGGRCAATARAPAALFADGRFYTADGRARFVATPASPPRATRRSSFRWCSTPDASRDQWHTMTRTGTVAAPVGASRRNPTVEIAPRRCGGARHPAGDAWSSSGAPMAALPAGQRSPTASVRAAVFVAHALDRPVCQRRPASTRWSRPRTDPVSGQPALKSTRIEARAFAAAWHGFAVLRDRPARSPADYWALARTRGGWRVELAGAMAPADWTEWARALLPAAGGGAPRLSRRGKRPPPLRRLERERLAGAIFIAREPLTLGRTVPRRRADRRRMRPRPNGSGLLAAWARKARPRRDRLLLLRRRRESDRRGGDRRRLHQRRGRRRPVAGRHQLRLMPPGVRRIIGEEAARGTAPRPRGRPGSRHLTSNDSYRPPSSRSAIRSISSGWSTAARWPAPSTATLVRPPPACT